MLGIILGLLQKSQEVISLEPKLTGDFRTTFGAFQHLSKHRGALTAQWTGQAPLNTVRTSAVAGRAGCLATVVARVSHKRPDCCTEISTLQQQELNF